MKIYRDFNFDNLQSTRNLTIPIVNTTTTAPAQKGSIVYGKDNLLYISDGVVWKKVSEDNNLSETVSNVSSGPYSPTIGPNNFLHTISNIYKAFYTQVGNVVTARVAYLISPTSTVGVRETFSDVIDLPANLQPLIPFPTQFEVCGQITCNLGDQSNDDYGGGVVFSLPGSTQVEVFYDFRSAGTTQVLISVDITYLIDSSI